MILSSYSRIKKLCFFIFVVLLPWSKKVQELNDLVIWPVLTVILGKTLRFEENPPSSFCCLDSQPSADDRRGHSCFLLSLASDVLVLPALHKQLLELQLFAAKDETKEKVNFCSCTVEDFKRSVKKKKTKTKHQESFELLNTLLWGVQLVPDSYYWIPSLLFST